MDSLCERRAQSYGYLFGRESRAHRIPADGNPRPVRIIALSRIAGTSSSYSRSEHRSPLAVDHFTAFPAPGRWQFVAPASAPKNRQPDRSRTGACVLRNTFAHAHLVESPPGSNFQHRFSRSFRLLTSETPAAFRNYQSALSDRVAPCPHARTRAPQTRRPLDQSGHDRRSRASLV